MRRAMKRFLYLVMIWSSVFATAEVITMDFGKTFTIEGKQIAH